MFDQTMAEGGEGELGSARAMLHIITGLRLQAGRLRLGEEISRSELGDCLALAELNLLRLIVDGGGSLEDIRTQAS